MMHGRRSILAAALIVTALAAAAPPAQARSNDVTSNRTTVGSPPDFPTFVVQQVPAVSIDLSLIVTQGLERATDMAKVLNLDSLVRVDSVAVDSAGLAQAIRQRHVTRNDTSSLNSDSISAALPATVLRTSVPVRMRPAAIVQNYLTAQSASPRGRIIGRDAFPLYL